MPWLHPYCNQTAGKYYRPRRSRTTPRTIKRTHRPSMDRSLRQDIHNTNAQQGPGAFACSILRPQGRSQIREDQHVE